MKTRYKALAWAALMIGGAIAMQACGFSDAASYGVTAGLGGAAWGTLSPSSVCTGGCLQ